MEPNGWMVVGLDTNFFATIESGEHTGLLLNLPAWAALSAGNLGGGLVLPSTVRNVTVAADADPVGMAEAYKAARRWRVEGRTVRIIASDTAGTDFNDRLQQDGAHGACIGGNP